MAHAHGSSAGWHHGGGNGGRNPEEEPLQPHRRPAAFDQRPRLFLPLLLAVVLLSASSVCSKFLASREAGGGRSNDSDTRLSAGGPAGPSSADAWVEGDDKDWNISDDCMAGATFALQGVDLVAYFSLAEGDEPVLGSSDYVAAYGDYRFKFSSAKNKALFEESPSTYLPAWGGFCSYGIPWEETWTATELGPPIDINQHVITSVDGKLRFFRSETTKMLFLEDVPTFIATGNSRWTGWFGDDETGYPYDVSCFCTVDTC